MSEIQTVQMESANIRSDITSRWHDSWQMYSQGSESGSTNLTGVSKIFLRSVFEPQSFPVSNEFPDTIDRTLLAKLSGQGPYSGVKPTELVLTEAENKLIQKILDIEPPLVPGALETLKKLSEKSNVMMWTVGDTDESKHSLPESLVGQKDVLPGTGHQRIKLQKTGITNNPDIKIHVSDDKINRVTNLIRERELNGEGNRFVFMDDTFSNLETVQALVDQENLQREIMGEDPIQLELVLVNQGRKRKDPPPVLNTKGSNSTYRTIDSFDQSVGLIEELSANLQDKLGVFCDFDGVLTDNTKMREIWDDIAIKTVEEVVEKTKIVNPQKQKRGGQGLSVEDLTVEATQTFVESCRKKGLKIGVKNGAFDIIQPGHIGGFDDARAACDVLIVMLNSDKSIQEYKPIKENVPRPLVDEVSRADVLLGLQTVDGVVLFNGANPSDLIRAIKPNVYISSKEYEGKELDEFKAADEIGADVVLTSIREGYSTSSIVKRILTGFLGTMETKGKQANKAVDILKRLAGYN